MAAQCLTTQLLVPTLRSKTFDTLLSKLRPSISSKAGRQQHCALVVLGALAKRAPTALGLDREELLGEITGRLSARAGGATGTLLKAQCESQCLGLKVLSLPYLHPASALPFARAGPSQQGRPTAASTPPPTAPPVPRGPRRLPLRSFAPRAARCCVVCGALGSNRKPQL